MTIAGVPLSGGGTVMPLLGFGTWQMTGRQAADAVRLALVAGYRHIDTATMYRNEAEVGDAINESGVGRENVFITTKLPPNLAARARHTLDESLRLLGTEYVDLWLIHWPVDHGASPATWRELLAARDAGLAKNVGVSNYSPAQLDELLAVTGIAPAVNQIPWSPKHYDARLYAYHREHDIVLEGYSPFKGSNLKDPVLVEIARAHGVTAAQVVLRWHIDKNIVVIPKSATPERIKANFDIGGFSLTAAEVERIDSLGH
jgi:diketogulonate reductase-like aldo/keto reductase